jgi:acetyl esterase/lipase
LQAYHTWFAAFEQFCFLLVYEKENQMNLKIVNRFLIVFILAAIVYADDKEKNIYKQIKYEIDANIPYLGENRNEKMDVYYPVEKTDKPLPAIIFIHGGGWAIGSKNDNRSKTICSSLVQQGYIVCSIDYQLTKYESKPWKSKKIKGAWPQNIYDCKTAVRYIRKNSKFYNVDTENIGVIGCSAGGHLALLTALSADSQELNKGGLYTDYSCNVRCVVDMYGIPDIRIWGGNCFIDVDRAEMPDIWALASPVTHLSNSAPPILVIHGDKDKTINIKQSIDFVNTLKEKKLKYEFVIVNGGVHSFGLEPPQIDLRPIVFKFFAKYLKGVQ